MCVCVYIYIYIYMCMYICIYICMCVYMFRASHLSFQHLIDRGGCHA